jgi:hypothetical protein
MLDHIKKILYDNFNPDSIIGEILWGGVIMGLAFVWGRFKAGSKPLQREIGMWITGTVMIVLLLTLVNQIASRKKPTEGFKSSLILGSPIIITDKGTNSAPTNVVSIIGGVAPENWKQEKGIDMLFILRVVNPGPPSVAWNWSASVLLPGGTTYRGTIPALGSFGIAENIPTIIGPFSATTQNNLIKTMTDRPLESGGNVIGWIIVHVNGLNSPPIGARFDISFEDVFGNKTTVSDVWNVPAPP